MRELDRTDPEVRDIVYGLRDQWDADREKICVICMELVNETESSCMMSCNGRLDASYHYH